MRTETEIREEIGALRSLTTARLKERYREVFGEPSGPNHRQFLFRPIPSRIRADTRGGLSERARRCALEITGGAGQRIRASWNARDRQMPGRKTQAQRHLALVIILGGPRFMCIG